MFGHVEERNHFFHVSPDEVDQLVTELDALRCPDLRIARYHQFAGREAYALTFTSAQGDWRARRRLFVSRPHAHEPAGVAAQTEMAKVLAGWGGLAESHGAWRDWALNRFVLTLLPDGNPSGSQRAPVKFWDGSYCPNSRFALWMFGESGDTPGETFPRVPAWDMREVTPPALLGICYEQIDASTYVEPNRDQRSTFFRSFLEHSVRYGYQVWLDLHQTEFEDSPYNAGAYLPTCLSLLEAPAQDRCVSLGKAIHARWRREGGNPLPKPVASYAADSDQGRYLSAAWLPICKQLTHIVTEVQNNSPRTSPRQQVRLELVAILETMEWMERTLPLPRSE